MLSCATLGRAFTASAHGGVRSAVSRGLVSMSTISDFKANKIDGTEVDLSSFQGKPTLVLNVASL